VEGTLISVEDCLSLYEYVCNSEEKLLREMFTEGVVMTRNKH